MLYKTDEIIFGDGATVFAEKESDYESHVTPQIFKTSDFQSRRYLADAQTHLLGIFNQLPLGQQPRYLAHIGCGDGSFLKQLYQFILENSKRGEQLAKFPLTLIGVDENQSALKEASRTLDGLSNLVISGDINEPQKFLKDLALQGIKKPEKILYISCFWQHNFTFEYSQETVDSLQTLSSDSQRAYVDSQGNSLDSAQVLSVWKHNLVSWAKLINSHGVLILGSHRLSSKETCNKLNASENIYFDSLHAFSHKYLISAESFFILAANVGLFAKIPPKRYPEEVDFSLITLTHFEKCDYKIRSATTQDLKTLCQLEELCWANELQTSDADIAARIKNYPQGQFVLERDGEVVGVIYSQRIQNTELLEGKTTSTVASLHTPDGEVVLLLAVNIHPTFQNLKLGDQLLEFMLQRSILMNRIKSVSGVTRCKGYDSDHLISFEKYICLRDKQGRIQDPVLYFHESHGASIKKSIAGYRPKDLKNEGFGVLVHYDIQNRVFDRTKTAGKINSKAPSIKNSHSEINSDEILRFVKSIILNCLENEQEFSMDRPLMEMGLDSSDLLVLEEQIVQNYSIKPEHLFFFKHNTAEKVVQYLEGFLLEPTLEPLVLEPAPSAESSTTDLREMDQNYRLAETARSTDVAIIGISCKLPGNINNVYDLWDLLEKEESGISELPQKRFLWPEGIDPNGKHLGIHQGGFVQNVSSFDAPFFRISPREAECMDPQQRILLELSWACLEDGGITSDSLKCSKTGVFIGASGSDYTRLLQDANIEVEALHGTGNSMAILANRISYFFDFSGPSLLIDTACSSSLVAVHNGVQSLNLKECDQALVGGINLICHPANSISYYKAGMLSEDGRCKTFDQKANGYVRSEGAVMLLLKPLHSAIRDSNLIHGVIKGSAINHGGLSGGLTVPNPEKQKELLQAAWVNGGIAPSSLGYIEAHGTGTPLGDPIEIRGVLDAFKDFHKTDELPSQICGIGSLKSNLGHLEAAAGIAGLLKTVMCLKQQQLPPTIHFKNLNPEIEIENTPLYVVSKLQAWNSSDGKTRRAGVSSFGSGGTNAHVVVEEYLPKEDLNKNDSINSHSAEPLLIPLSAKTEEQLKQTVSNILEFVRAHIPINSTSEKPSTCHMTLQELEQVISRQLSKILSVKEDVIDPTQKFADFGLEPFQQSELCQSIIMELKLINPGYEMDFREFQGLDSIHSMANHLLSTASASIKPDPADPRKNRNGINLKDFAYTLQTGRVAMERRLGLIVTSLNEVEEKLQQFLDGKQNIQNFVLGHVKRDKDFLSIFTADEELKLAIDTWVSKKKYSRILDLWVNGVVFDWNKLYGEVKPNRISLPTYPFARESYWVPKTEEKIDKVIPGEIKMLNETKEVEIVTSEKEPQVCLSITTDKTCTNEQKEYIEQFIGKYTERTKKSKSSATYYRDYFADQRTPIYFNFLLKEVHYPLTYENASGSYLYDVDGNKYIDISGDYGVNIFGHQPSFIKDALKKQIDSGLSMSGRYDIIGQSAQLFCELTGHDRIVFCQSGSESLMSVLRIARAYTGRGKYAVFENSYHGITDAFLDGIWPGLVESSVNEQFVFEYGNFESLEKIARHASELAAIIVEPVQSAHLELQPVEFLKALQKLANREGILLIFDEMITGFRVHLKGCQGYFGIKADLATYGKIIGGGNTGGAVAGKKEYMKWVDGGVWKYGDNSRPSAITRIAGTHTQNPLKMAGTLAVLQEMKRQSPELQKSLNEKTTYIATELNKFTNENNIPMDIVHFGSIFRFRFFTKGFVLTQGLFLYLLNYNGVKYNLHGNCFLTTAHSDQDIDTIISVIQKSLGQLLNQGFFYKSEEGEQDIVKRPHVVVNSNYNEVSEIDLKSLIKQDLDKLL